MGRLGWGFGIGAVLLAACSAPGVNRQIADAVPDQEEHRRIAEEFIRKAAEGNVNGLLASMASITLASNDQNALEGYLRGQIAPFFRDYAHLRWQGQYMKVRDGQGNTGVQYYEFIESGNGERRPFVITLFPEKGGHRVSSIVVGECFRGYHSACP